MASTSAALIRVWPVDGYQGRDGPTVGSAEVVRISSAGACTPDTAVLCARHTRDAAGCAEPGRRFRELRDVSFVAGDSVLVAVELRRISGLTLVDRCGAGGPCLIARSVADRRFRYGRQGRGWGRRNHARCRWWRHGDGGGGNDRGDRLHGSR